MECDTQKQQYNHFEKKNTALGLTWNYQCIISIDLIRYIYIYIVYCNYTRMVRVILNKPCRQHHRKKQLYGPLHPITKTIKVRRTRHARHCWRSRDELISDVLLWNPSHGGAKAGWLARTYIQQLCEDTGDSSADLPERMKDQKEWRERVRDIRAGGMTRW